MPQRAQMEKHVRKTRTRTLRNRARRRDMKAAIRAVMDAAHAGDAEAVKEAMPEAQQAIDKAARHGIVHQNTADRRKSRLVARVRRILGEE
jgi:small subunit ribosomal protein S20